ncbi:FxSxx-COOH cyclophane-containing RiPP peptide [Streptomyces sp. 150FB]|uniref:FxSxx-COOH cyclophane-containing RiPP peptide n=1 Tax=Streptomyces sp. 150FB TaxID=1576605 RepID=UPI00099B3AC1|nr:FxSxx-COOH cyclophane-containing RiPP peptide [Streptomyces sp. 150FB]
MGEAARAGAPGTTDATGAMDAPDSAETPEVAPDRGELPDLLALDLTALRTLDHPVLSEVVADLRGRAGQPREMLWGFNNAF